MKLSIIFFLGLITTTHLSEAQTRASDILECFNLLFDVENFDSIYYKHDKSESNIFFILKEGSAEEVSVEFPKDKNLFDLKNGNSFSINSKGMMFMWDIKYYLKFQKNQIDHDKCSFLFEGIKFDGFSEKVLERRKMSFVREGSQWKKVRH